MYSKFELCGSMCKKPLLFLFFIIPQCLWGQAQFIKDTLFASGDSVVVTATRSERKLSNLTVPVTLINAQTIQQTGSIRLTDILKEQTGLSTKEIRIGIKPFKEIYFVEKMDYMED